MASLGGERLDSEFAGWMFSWLGCFLLPCRRAQPLEVEVDSTDG